MAKKHEGRKKIRFLWRIVVVFLTILGILGVTLFEAGSLFDVPFLEFLLSFLKNGNGKDEKPPVPDTPPTALDVAIINHIDDDGQMNLIPEGTFRRNNVSPSEWTIHTVHTVHVDAFYMDRYEVTNAQYKKFIDANPRWEKNRIQAKYSDDNYLKHWTGNDYPKDRGNYPVTNVSWYAAMAYAWSVGKRLPTEAEWEKASWGERWRGALRVHDPSQNYARIDAVGHHDTNKYGLFDLTENAAEWCLDEYDADFYRNSRSDNPFSGGSLTDVVHNFTKLADRNAKKARVIRGGPSPDKPGEGITSRWRHFPKRSRPPGELNRRRYVSLGRYIFIRRVSIVFLLFAVCFTGHPIRSQMGNEKMRVSVNISCDDQITKGAIESFLKRELRSLGDVKIEYDLIGDYSLALVVIEMEYASTENKTGYIAISSVFTKNLRKS